jgi:hypothetical protein
LSLAPRKTEMTVFEKEVQNRKSKGIEKLYISNFARGFEEEPG